MTLLYKTNDLDDIVERLLAEIGVPAHLLGYDFLVEAVARTARAPIISTVPTVPLYVEVAAACDSTKVRVERGIRHAVTWVFDNVDWDAIDAMFGNSVSKDKGAPTNHHFIATLAREARRRAKEV